MRFDLVARQARDAFDRRQRQRVQLLAARTISACVIASVNGRRIVNRGPCPGCVSMKQRAAELLDLGGDHVHADAAAGLLRHLLAVLKPGSRISCSACSSVSCWFARSSPSARALVADRREVEAGAVVGDLDDDLRALAMQLQRDRAGLGLAALRAVVRRLDAVHDRVAQHVLERRQHALEHLAVELAGRALDDELGLLAGLGAAWRTMRVRRCTWRWNGTMRVRMRPFCSSVTTRACCVSRFCASFVRFVEQLLMLPTSFADSASARESCWIVE